MPPMVLLPLVDYAFATSPTMASCASRARERCALRFDVATHRWIARLFVAAEASLAALRERLDTLYGDAARLSIGSRGDATRSPLWKSLMRTTTAVIAEDEEVLRGELREMLASQWPDLDVVAEVGDGAAACRAVEELAPTIVFLDIEMPGASGLEVARRVSGKCHVVFVTAYDNMRWRLSSRAPSTTS